MTSDIKRFAFLLRQKPICTQSPIKSSLGPELHRDLRAKYKLELGLDLLDDRCPNSFNCIASDSGCIGRPFPIDDDIKQALSELNVDVSIGFYKGREVYLAKAVTSCSGCPLQGQCEVSCATQDSFLSRSTKPESNPPDSALVPYEDFERGMYKAITPEDIEHCEYGEWAEYDLPLDCLTPKQRQVIEMTFHQGLEQAQIAESIGITQPAVSKQKTKALSKLKEFGKARKIISQSTSVPTRVIDYYVNNLSNKQIAVKYGISEAAASKSISKWKKDNFEVSK